MHASIACLLLYEDYVWVSLGNAMKAKQSKERERERDSERETRRERDPERDSETLLLSRERF